MPRPARHSARHSGFSPSTLPSAVVRLTALLAVGTAGTAALTAVERSAAPAASVAASATAAAPRTHAAVEGRPLVRARHRSAAGRGTPAPAPAPAAAPAPASGPQPAPQPVAPQPAPAASPVRWLPSGTGMWIYQWGRTDGGNGRRVVHRALKAGLTTLYVRTGSSHDGFTGQAMLDELLPATAGTPLHVVAWDFPELYHPVADARRLAQAAWVGDRTHGPSVAAVAPDIETYAEGTQTSRAAVATYLRTLRARLPRDVAILATVPWPSRYRVGSYPYGTVAAHSDAILPMAYWYDNNPVDVTETSIRYLRQFHRPVQPVGQGYDSKIDVPSLPHSDLKRQVPAFLHTAHRLGAKAVSVWSWQSAPKVTWHALAGAHRMFPPGTGR